jgi:hypothetical protein
MPRKISVEYPIEYFLMLSLFLKWFYYQVTGFIFTSDVSLWKLKKKKNVNLLLWTVVLDIRRRIALCKGFHAYPAYPSDKIT